MRSLGSTSLSDDGSSGNALSRGSSPSPAATGAPGRLLRVTDRIVALLPRPLRELLRRPVTSPQQPVAVSTATIVRMTLALSVISFLLLALTDLVDVLALNGRIAAFDADQDGGVWTWASVAAEAGGATLLAMLAATSVRWRAYALTGLGLAFFSLDDAVLIHEKLALALSFFPHSGRFIWPLLYLPLLVVLSVQLWRIADAQEGTSVRALVRGGLIALAIAVVLEVGSTLLFVVDLGESLLYELEVVLEEGLEMVGWIWIGGALAVAVVQTLGRGSGRQVGGKV
jgi:hypothetical protein